ncbi:hypothetical protein TPS_06425 [Trichinella pseudospiralis]
MGKSQFCSTISVLTRQMRNYKQVLAKTIQYLWNKFAPKFALTRVS